MRGISRLFAALILTGSATLGCQAPAASASAELSEQDMTTLRGTFDSAAQWIRAGDWVSWSGIYSEDAVLQPPNAPTVTGRPALLAWGQAFPPVQDLTFSDVHVAGEGNLAYGTSSYSLTIQGAPTDTGKQLVVFRRGTNGEWQVVAVSFNSDLPVPGQAGMTTTSLQ
jgi:ketosteroid isomerase-like protein